MKIVILVSKLTGGGAERVASLWANGFIERGHDVSIVVSTKNKKDTTYPLSPNIKIHSIGSSFFQPKIRTVINKFRYLLKSRQRRLSDVLHKINPDVVIAVLYPWDWDAYMVTRDMDVKIINTEHNSFERPETSPMKPDKKKDKFENNMLYDHVTLLTHADKKVLGDSYSNVTVLPNPLTFIPVEDIPAKEKVILVSGRLDAWHCKGFDIVIKAFAKICRQHTDWCLRISGTGEKQSLEYLQNIAKEEGVSSSQIEFLGFCNNMQSVYKNSSIFVLSSRYEGFGMVLTEAMSQGCACIACDYKGRQSEIITDASQGIVCPVEDINALAKAMEKMIVDDDYRTQCQKNAIERSKYYSLDKTMDRWDEIFKKLGLHK